MAPKILIVLTSVGKIESINHPTGWYLPELAHPYDVLAPKTEIVIASPKGGVAPLDPGSVKMFEKDESSVNFLNSQKKLWEQTTPLREFLGRADEFDALFFPGGHGPMFDLATDVDSNRLVREFWAAGKPVAAVCHGPAALANVTLEDGSRLVKGRTVTGFTNVEEDQVQMTGAMPFLLETALNDAGAKFVKADEPWGAKVVTDGKLITGQNPASAKGVGEAILEALGI
ncbi:chaperone protein-like protein [Hapsidospora chrysogenum ATCC 11550]|uniref:D-lactate dehydratase n=1 Tax=Hapsidospora chrysogenum (strain ATCC 11550 / CBS 779.69 / DSM 880 / IAM 14645 / JCM 23072 / IMI 49137) TaxID=857340 RepID=A0A086SYB7_HAPC1|nr:chaperone protein-like protein [Hapsidospora chrysogenum ATCC 11550]